ncbi:MAG TPA: myxococcus cysteine-rich repeat containing protein [Nannocystaceae bacterium]|nr:myxococcus cysteine-rich repeat containing protein [Nannocystaceae bacterium]
MIERPRTVPGGANVSRARGRTAICACATRSGRRVLAKMTRSFSTLAVGSYLCVLTGCFEQAPSVGEGGSSEGSGSASEESATSSSMSNGSSGSPTSSPDGSGSEAPSGVCGDGAVEGDEICDDGNEQDGDGCESDCRPSSGYPLWTVVEDEANTLAIYTVAVTPEGDIIAGGVLVDADDLENPWLARYAPDGTRLWTEATPAEGGEAHYRGLTVLADGRVLGVGAVKTQAEYDDAWLRVVDVDGNIAWQHEVQTNTADTYLLSIAPRQDGGFVGVGSATDASGTRPFVAPIDPNGDSWQQGINSEDVGTYANDYGQMFSVVSYGTGLLVVGSARVDPMQPSDAAAWLLTADGDALGPPDVFGGEGDQDFIDVAVDGDDVHAIGRSGMGTVSALRIAKLDVGDSVALAWEQPWSDEQFNVGNALAASGGVRYVAASTTPDPDNSDAYDSRVLRWDGEESDPRWSMPYEDPSPGLDYAADVAIAPDGTVVVVGPMTPEAGGDVGSINAWVRKLAP